MDIQKEAKLWKRRNAGDRAKRTYKTADEVRRRQKLEGASSFVLRCMRPLCAGVASWIALYCSHSAPQVLEEAGEKGGAAAPAERQTIIDMRGPQVELLL